MYELMNTENEDLSGWLFSGKDTVAMAAMMDSIFEKAVSLNFIQVVIVTEDMFLKMKHVLEKDLRNQAYLPSDSWGYFPVFRGNSSMRKRRFLELFQIMQESPEGFQALQDYIDFLQEFEEECGVDVKITEDFLLKYTRISAVEKAMSEAMEKGWINAEEFEDLFGEYTLRSAGRIRLKTFLNCLNDLFSIKKEKKSIDSLNPGERICFVIQPDMTESICKMIFQMIGWDILDAERKGRRISLSVIEGNKKYGMEILKMLDSIGTEINFNMFSQDFFAGHSEEWKDKISEYFHRFVYSAHTRMESCDEISSKRFGTFQIVRTSYSVDRDRRIENNRMLDRLFDTNKVEHYVQHTPVWEPKYRKEEIYEMPSGTCLVQMENYEGYVRFE